MGIRRQRCDSSPCVHLPSPSRSLSLHRLLLPAKVSPTGHSGTVRWQVSSGARGVDQTDDWTRLTTEEKEIIVVGRATGGLRKQIRGRPEHPEDVEGRVTPRGRPSACGVNVAHSRALRSSQVPRSALRLPSAVPTGTPSYGPANGGSGRPSGLARRHPIEKRQMEDWTQSQHTFHITFLPGRRRESASLNQRQRLVQHSRAP